LKIPWVTASTIRETVSPGIIAGSGLKNQSRRGCGRTVPVSPGIIAGSGLKIGQPPSTKAGRGFSRHHCRERIEKDYIEHNETGYVVSPDIIAGSGLKTIRRPGGPWA
jgi:hypothetical protein